MLNSGNVYKYLDEISGGFWNCKKLLTYNRPLNFVTGSRSVGKSTNIAAFFVLDFIRNGHKFIYCRRTLDETRLTCAGFFGNAVRLINEKTDFNIENFRYYGGDYFITIQGEEERPCGCIVSLSQEQKYKSADFSEYCNLVFDEFICQDSTKYLGSKATPDKEYRAILSLYQTIDRGIDKPFRNETRFFFLGNTATIYNPLFLSLDISRYIEAPARYIAPKNKLWILERIESVPALEEAENSFAYLMADAEGRDYAFKNTGNDSTIYIEKLPQSRLYLCTLVRNKRKYGVWAAQDFSRFYIGEHKDIGREIISLDIQSHTSNDLTMITRWQDYPIINRLVDAFKQSKLYFTNGRAQAEFLTYFKLMP